MPWIVKAGANISTLRAEIKRLEPRICNTFEDFGDEAVVTSGNDGVHQPKNGNPSLHYKDLAIDLRAHQFTVGAQAILRAVVARSLAEEWPGLYDVLLEFRGEPRAHLHLEASDRLLAELGIAKEEQRAESA